jgi:hypothetical protein
MIGQNIGLPFLIPIAIKQLAKNILAEGDYYEGDLLKAVLTSEHVYWKNNIKNWQTIIDLFNDNTDKLKSFDTTYQIKKEWLDAFETFKNINV